MAGWHHRNNRERPGLPGHGRADAVARKPLIDLQKSQPPRNKRAIGFAHGEPSRPRRKGHFDMTIPANSNSAAPMVANDRSRPSPRIKLSRRRIAIQHPDPQAGERLLAEALGAVDRDALHGLLKQLMSASVINRKADEANLAFMISMVKSIGPRDSIEAMLVTQMVAVHAATMRSACRLAFTDGLPQQESITRALTRLARTFASQIEALNRHRSSGERAIMVQNVSVQDGGSAIVGNVTQHANVIVAEPDVAAAAINRRPVPSCETGEREHATQGAGA